MQLTALFAASVLFLTGRLEAALPALFQEARQGTNLEAEKKELAAIRLTVAAERKFTDAKQRLLALDQTLSTSTHADARALRAELATLLTEVRRTLGEVQTPSGGKIDEAARSAIQQGDYAFIAQLGAAAAPALREEVLRQPDFLPSEVLADPFYHLLEADPLAASVLCEELASQNGFFWRRRVLRALEQRQGFIDGRMWDPSHQSTRVPGLIAAFERCLADPALTHRSLELVTRLLSQKVLTPGLRAGLAAALTSEEGDVRARAWRNCRAEALVPLYEEWLGSADADLRQRAAQQLVSMGSAGASLLARADDEVVGVRIQVASWLKGLPLERWTEPERETLARLLQDPEVDVAQRAVDALERQAVMSRPQPNGNAREVFRAPFSDSVYLALAESPHLEVRRALQADVARKLEVPLGTRVLARLAADRDAEVADGARRYWFVFLWEDPAGTLAVLDALLANPSLSREAALRGIESLEGMWTFPEGRNLLASWLLERNDEELLRKVNCSREDIPQLEPALFVRYLRRLHDLDLVQTHSLLFTSRDFDAPHLASLKGLALDREAPIGLRFLASGSILARRGPGEALHPMLPALFREAEELTRTDRFEWRSILAQILRDLPGPVRNECLLALIQAPGVPAAMVDNCLPAFDALAPGAGELLRAVLETRYESSVEEERRLAWRALGYLGKPGLADRAWLERAARDPLYRAGALSAIGQLRDPSYLPLFDELLRGGDSQAAAEVASALTNFLSQEAGELLLVAATKLSGEVRDQALAHLTKIREYQEAREQWAVRRTSQQTRAAVVAELVAKLDAKSEEVKVEAIRALATWEAVEAMPRLIELTQSGSKSVAAAARAALERLNAPKETTGG